MRTWLFVPGHDARKMQKALRSGAEVVVIDWEDAVPEDRKNEARATTRSILTQAPPRSKAPRYVVRVNNTRYPSFTDDIAALAELRVSAVMLPKVADPAEVVHLAGLIEQPVIPLIESALGVELAYDIARAHVRVERLAFGSLDFVADIGGRWTPEGEAYEFARARVSIAGRAAGLEGAIDSVYPWLEDAEGLRRDAAGARALGFAGKLLVHPAQIPIVREVFSPTPEEVAEATEVIRAFEEARARGESVVRLRGRLVDPPVVLWARQMLATHDADAHETIT
jgi:citrate lyase subunit beta / citryl-CoA lyase